MILKEIFQAVQKPKTYSILDIPTQTVFKVADTVDVAANMGIKVEWIDKFLEKIGANKDHYTLIQETQSLEEDRRGGTTNIRGQTSLGEVGHRNYL